MSNRQTIGTDLCAEDRAYVLNAYIHRMTDESIARFPEHARRMRAGGYRMPAFTDAQWLACTWFATKANGRLDARSRYCECRRPLPAHEVQS